MVGFSSLFFLVSTWWSVLVICAKHCDSCMSLCEIVHAFVCAVSQLFFLLGSHIGNHRIYLQIDFCKTILSFSPYCSSPPPSLNNLAIHVAWLPCLLLCCTSSDLCFWEAGLDSVINTDLGASNLDLPQLGLGTLEKSPGFVLWSLTEVYSSSDFLSWILSCMFDLYFFLFCRYALYCHGFRDFIWIGALFCSLHPGKKTN